MSSFVALRSVWSMARCKCRAIAAPRVTWAALGGSNSSWVALAGLHPGLGALIPREWTLWAGFRLAPSG